MFFLFIIYSSALEAQLFFKNDSVSSKSILQFELGGYYGVHHVKPFDFEGFTNKSENGIDVGFRSSFILNLLPKLSLGMNLNSFTNTTSIEIQNKVFREFFHLTMKGYQKSISIAYHFENRNRQICSITLGIGKQKGIYTTSMAFNEYFEGGPLTIIGDQFIDNHIFNYWVYSFNIRKSFRLNDNVSIAPFFEIEGFNKSISKENAANLQTGYQKYYSDFRRYNSKIGFIISFS